MNKKQSLIWIATVALVLLSAVIIGSAAIPAQTPDVTETDSIPVSAGADSFNILLTGSDRTSGLTDVIMLVSLDRKNGKAVILQIPRDTYASYTDKSYKKLNGAYGALGGEGMCRFLSDSLGVSIDRYIMLSPDAFTSAVDAVGGVEVTLPEPMYYNDPYQDLYISLGAGRQILDGKRAEQFIRYRSGYANGDLGRIDTQKLFMSGFIRAVRRNTDPLSLARLYASLSGKTDTNITPADALSLSEELLALDDENIIFITAAGEALIAEKSGASYYALSAKAMEECLGIYFGSTAPFDKDRVFLNKSYRSFREVYEGYSEYKAYSAKNISESRMGIDK